jgi:hypothetical protein
MRHLLLTIGLLLAFAAPAHTGKIYGLAEDGTPLLTEDGDYILVEP